MRGGDDEDASVTAAGYRTLWNGQRLQRIETPQGQVIARCNWRTDGLDHIAFWLPGDKRFVLTARAAHDPLLGICDSLGWDATEPVARVAAIRWQSPQWIPAIDRPGALPSGAGTAILNALAICAERAGVQALRYRGPYPTAALFDSLHASFSVQGDVERAFERFTEPLSETSRSGECQVNDVRFIPDPHAWHRPQPEVCVQLRRGLDRVYLWGQAFSPLSTIGRRLVPAGSDWVARFDLGPLTGPTLARFNAKGALLKGPSPIPATQSPLLGQPLAAELRRALAQALPPRAPPLLQPALRLVLERIAIVWADTGLSVAQSDGQRLLLHVNWTQAIAGLSAVEALELLARAIEPSAQRLAQEMLAQAQAQTQQ
jgi:hypothetical protein